jgi:hypothetical protein
LLSLFRNKLAINIAWVVVFSALIQVLFWLWQSPAPPVYYTSPLMAVWLEALHQTTGGVYISAALVFVLSLGVAFGFNYLINRQEILFRQTVFPVFFFFYYSHLFPQQNLLSPHFFSGILIVLIIYKYLALEARGTNTTPFIDMGFFTGLAYCISPDMLLFVPAIFLSLLASGYFSFKTLMLFVTGLFIPIYFLGIAFFLADEWPTFITIFTETTFTLDYTRFDIDYYHIAILAITVVVLIAGISGLRSHYMKNTIRARKAQQMLAFFIVNGLCVVFCSKAPIEQSFTIVAAPLSVFVSYYFLLTKGAWIRQILFSLFILIIIIALAEVYFFS